MPPDGAQTQEYKGPNRKILAALIASAVAMLFIAANTHLVYVAITSQPECIGQAGSGHETENEYRPARSVC